jgi:hypothetical protein
VPFLQGPALQYLEEKYDGSLFKWNGDLLRVTVATCVDLGYAIMRLSGYLVGPNEVIFKALDHTMRYLYFYCRTPIMYPSKTLSKNSLSNHWQRGTTEYISPEYGTQFINSSDADHACDLRNHCSVISAPLLLNGVIVACMYNT